MTEAQRRHHYNHHYTQLSTSPVPRLGAREGVGVGGGVVDSPGLHAPGVAAVVWLSQPKAANELALRCGEGEEEEEAWLLSCLSTLDTGYAADIRSCQAE